jgi:hypothetical protein
MHPCCFLLGLPKGNGAVSGPAAIVHWNTVYLDRAVRHLRAQGAKVPDDLLAHVVPLGWEHIGDRRLRLDRGEPGHAVSAATRGSFYVPAPGRLAYDFEQIVW